jgi:hypothetical protein
VAAGGEGGRLVIAGRLRAGACTAAVGLALAGCGSPGLEKPPVVSPSAPVFADLTAPDVTSAVAVLAFDPVAASTVIEPIVFLTGHDFCASFGVTPADSRCARGFVLEESRTKVTLPLDPQVRLRTTRDGDKACRGTAATGATCPATMTAFAAAVRARPAMPARITVRGGVVADLAQLYTP